MNEHVAPTTPEALVQEPITQTSVTSAPPIDIPPERRDGLTPAGIQSRAVLSLRRWLVLVLNVVTFLGLMAVLARVLGAGGWTLADMVIFVAFAFGAPWTVLGFWNAVLGFWLLHVRKDGLAEVAPYIHSGETGEPLVIRTAMLMTLRNEDPARAFARLRVVKASVDATGQGAAFDYFVLSDTNLADVAEQEACRDR
jgi:membrane glycosyltransferase